MNGGNMSGEELAAVQRSAAELASREGFGVRGPFAQRHGGWVATFTKRQEQAPGVARYVVLGITESPEGKYGSILVELTAVAEDSDFVAHETVSSFAVDPAEFNGTQEWFKVAFDNAMKNASRLELRQLKATRIFPELAVGAPER
jgi:hypothetical protein